MDADNALFLAWVMDRKETGSTRCAVLNSLRYHSEPLAELERCCHLEKGSERINIPEHYRKVRAEYRAFLLKSRARKYLLNRFISRWGRTPEQVFNHQFPKAEKPNNINTSLYAGLIAYLLGAQH